MFEDFIFYDVHPPLYNIMLHYWIYLLNDNEISTRLFSILCSAITIIVFSMWSYKKFSIQNAFVAIGFFSSNFYVTFYGQETRPYALLLLLSTLLTLLIINFIQRPRKLYLFIIALVGLLLSLTHYFGLLYSLIAITYLLLNTKKWSERFVFFMLNIIMMIWPIVHFIFGSIKSKRSGNFWITSDGIYDTTTRFFTAITPPIIAVFYPFTQYNIIKIGITMIGLGALLFLIFLTWQEVKAETSIRIVEDKKTFTFLTSVLLCFLFTIILIDYYTPITTPRNFIVLLPCSSLLFSFLIRVFKHRKKTQLVTSFVIIYALIGNAVAIAKLKSKYAPLQNYRDTADYIVDNHLLDSRTLYFHQVETFFPSVIYKSITRFYIIKSNYNKCNPLPLEGEELTTLKPTDQFLFVSMHYPLDTNRMISKLTAQGLNVDYYAPTQYQPNSSFIIYTE